MLFLILVLLISAGLSYTSKAIDSIQYTYDANGKLTRIYVQNEGEIKFTYDENGNVQRIRRTENLLKNGDFEQYINTTESSAPSWNLTPGMGIGRQTVKEGTASLQFNSGTPIVGIGSSDLLQAAGGTPYTLSGWLLSNLTSGEWLIDWLEYNAAGQILADGIGFSSTKMGEWEQGQVQFTTHPSTTHVRVRVVAEYSVGAAYADAIKLELGHTAW